MFRGRGRPGRMTPTGPARAGTGTTPPTTTDAGPRSSRPGAGPTKTGTTPPTTTAAGPTSSRPGIGPTKTGAGPTTTGAGLTRKRTGASLTPPPRTGTSRASGTST